MSSMALFFWVVGLLSLILVQVLFALYRGKKADIKLQEIAQELGLSYEEEPPKLYGIYQGFPVQIIDDPQIFNPRNTKHTFFSVIFTIDLQQLNLPPGLTVKAKKMFPLFVKDSIPTEDSGYQSIRLNDSVFDKNFIVYTLSAAESIEFLDNPAIKMLFLALRKSSYSLYLEDQILTFEISGHMLAKANKIVPHFETLFQLVQAMASSLVLKRSLSESTSDPDIVCGPEHPDYLEDTNASW